MPESAPTTISGYNLVTNRFPPHDPGHPSPPTSSIQMITALLSILAAAVVLYLVFFVVKMFIKGMVLSIIGAVFGLLLLVHALRSFGVVQF